MGILSGAAAGLSKDDDLVYRQREAGANAACAARKAHRCVSETAANWIAVLSITRLQLTSRTEAVQIHVLECFVRSDFDPLIPRISAHHKRHKRCTVASRTSLNPDKSRLTETMVLKKEEENAQNPD